MHVINVISAYCLIDNFTASPLLSSHSQPLCTARSVSLAPTSIQRTLSPLHNCFEMHTLNLPLFGHFILHNTSAASKLTITMHCGGPPPHVVPPPCKSCKSGGANLFNVPLKCPICCIFLTDYFVWVKCCTAELAKSLDSNYRYMYHLR